MHGYGNWDVTLETGNWERGISDEGAYALPVPTIEFRVSSVQFPVANGKWQMAND
jgi:hypothetical protein